MSAEVVGSVLERPRGRFFYGWWIVVVCGVGLLFLNGIGFYSFSAFLPHLIGEFHDRVAISAAATLYQGATGAFALLVGWAVDRFGARLLMPVGAAIMGVGLLVLSRADAIWQVYAAYIL